ncbi:MAG: MFS transporter [Clostridiaceae bacterium]|nr:MFS transporter [Eubacteriales bacterium]
MKPAPLGKRTWLTLLLFGFFGQVAWTIENMYFNVFVYNTITTDPVVVANMVAASALTATLTTLLMGGLSDRLGKRRAFMVYGYILWGVSTMAFAALSVSNIGSLVGPAAAVQVTASVVVLMDCVMTFFGSTANDAAFNAWVNDATTADQRGRTESVLAALPLLSTLFVFGALDGFTQAGRWDTFFLIVGGLVTLGGAAGFFFLRDSHDLAPKKEPYFKNLVYGLRPGVVKKNLRLYLALCGVGILGVGTQIYMPYLLIYIQHYQKITNYVPVLGAVLVGSAVVSVAFGRLIDKLGKVKFALRAVAVDMAGLAAMFFAKGPLALAGAGIAMMGGGMLLSACMSGLVRDYTPPERSGHFQGIRMLFLVLFPMAVGPYIGAAIINANSISAGGEQVPGPLMFLAAAAVHLLALAPLLLLHRQAKTEEAKA